MQIMGCAVSDTTISEFPIRAEPRVSVATIERCHLQEVGMDLSLVPGSWGDVNGPPNLVNFNISINSNGLTAYAGNPVDGTCFSADEIADDAWSNTTNSTVEVIYTVTPVRSCGTPNECLGDPVEIIISVAPELILSAYAYGTNDPVEDPILVCAKGVNDSWYDVRFDIDVHVDPLMDEFVRYANLGFSVNDPNNGGLYSSYQDSSMMANNYIPWIYFGDPSLRTIRDNYSLVSPENLVEPVDIAYYILPQMKMANGHVCSDFNDIRIINARIVPSPNIEFVFPGTPSGNDEMVCNGSANQVFLTLDPEHPSLEEGVDYDYQLNSIFYSLDGINFLPGYGPLTGGKYTPLQQDWSKKWCRAIRG